jgi:hypothetical protein
LILTTPAPSKFIPGNQIFFDFAGGFSEACRGGLGSSHFAGLNASRIDGGKLIGIKGWRGWSFTGWPIPDSLCLRTLFAIRHAKLAVPDCAPHPTRRHKTILYET